MAQTRDVHWWKRAAGLGPLWQRVRRLVPFCTLILRFHVEAAQEMPESRRVALERQLAANLERMIAGEPGRLRCQACRQHFTPRRRQPPHRLQRYCSAACRRRMISMRERDRSRGFSIERQGTCDECGRLYYRTRVDQHFCREGCRSTHNSRRRRAALRTRDAA